MHRMNDGLETHFLSSTFLQPVSHTQTLICQSRRWLTPTHTNPDIRVILITQATFLILYTNLIYTWFDLNTKHIWINSVEFRLNLKSISLTFVSNTVRMLCKILNTNKYKKTKQNKKTESGKLYLHFEFDAGRMFQKHWNRKTHQCWFWFQVEHLPINWIN